MRNKHNIIPETTDSQPAKTPGTTGGSPVKAQLPARVPMLLSGTTGGSPVKSSYSYAALCRKKVKNADYPAALKTGASYAQ